MKKISLWMLALIVVPGVVMLTGCKKEEVPAEEPMAAEATPTPMAAEPMVEASPMPEATPAAADAMAAPTPSPAAP